MPAILLAVIGSRIGQIALALLVGYGWGWWRTDAGWRETVSKERAAAEYARQVERVRQEAAAREIAAEATRRLAEEQEMAAAMRRQLDDLKRSEVHAPSKKECPACRVDDDFVKRMRDLDAAGRKATPSRRAR